MTKVTKKKPAQEVMVADTPMPGGGNSMISLIAQLAANPRVNADKMEKLLNMQERIVNQQADQAFSQAMARLQSKLPRITKKGKIAFTDKKGVERDTPYAKYEHIEAAIRSLYNAEGFATSFDTDTVAEGKIMVTLTVSHEGGAKRISKSPPMALDTSGSKNNLQAMGSTISYGKRYTLINAFNIVTEGEDDDGTAGGGKPGDKADKFTQKAAEQAKGQVIDVIVPRTEDQLRADATALRGALKACKTQEQRDAIMATNLPLIRELNDKNLEDIVTRIHEVAQGDTNAH